MGVLLATATAGACSNDTGEEIKADRPASSAPASATGPTVASLWAFTADLHRATVERSRAANTVIAPVAVALGLTQARGGAGGATRDQLSTVLHAGDGFDPGLDTVWRSLLAQSGERQDGDTGRKGRLSLELASSLWGQRNTRFGEPWLTDLATTWGTGIRVTDFRSDPEEARNAVNAWAAAETNNHITQLLRRGAVDELTRLLAPSAAYLRAPWAMPFELNETRLTSFRRLDGTLVTVPMMQRTAETGLRVADGDGWQAVEIPYLGDDLAMTIVIPDGGRFTDVETSLDGPALAALTRSMRSSAVDLAVPQFGFTTDLELEDTLRDLGVVDAFDPGVADFADITEDEPLSLAGVIHQGFLSVDEQGSEASASAPRRTGTTGVPGTGTSLVPPAPASGSSPTTAPAAGSPRRIVADRPFLVLVTDRTTGAPILYGRVVSPRG